jgi:hypothetical protein
MYALSMRIKVTPPRDRIGFDSWRFHQPISPSVLSWRVSSPGY